MAQDIAVGSWRTHFSYHEAKHLVATPSKVFCASTYGLFSRDIQTGEIRKLSKINGLSDVGVSTMEYDAEGRVLVIGYESGFVDFVFENQILSFSEVANSALDLNKTIHGIAFHGNNTYLATGLGVIVLKTSNASGKENFINIGSAGAAVEVFDIWVRNDSLFIRTSEGIQSGSLDENLLDFANWNRYAGTTNYTNLIKAGENIYATSGDTLMVLGSNWQDTSIDLPYGWRSLFNVENELFTASDQGKIFKLSGNVFSEVETINGAIEINDILSTNEGFFIADGRMGLINADGMNLGPDGPVSDNMSNVRVVSGNVYGFHAPSVFGYDGRLQQASFSVFSEGLWEARTIENFTNVTDVASLEGVLFFSSMGDGLFNEETQEITSDIPGSSPELDTLITALAGGSRLWVSSFGTDQPIHTLDGSGNWSSHASSLLLDNEFLSIDLSDLGVAWLGSSSGAITVFDPEANLTDLISVSDGLPSAYTDVAISIEDNAWVSTSSGPAFFPSASFIFSNQQAILPTFENRILFEGEQVNAVMTDGGNRIWFGTNDGLWVYDENTSEQVAVFRVSNSPLPSNRIVQLAYNGTNGEVFIYTDKGLVSYRSASSNGGRMHRNVRVFPNPVRPGYQGLVGITGLASNAEIKITDINGNLVKSLVANGGAAAWDLQDGQGGKVKTGIYYIFSSSSDGEETYVGKVAVIR